MPRRTDQLRLCAINVRSIAIEARLADFEASVEKIKFDVMGVSETRIPGQGGIDLASGIQVYFSCDRTLTSVNVGSDHRMLRCKLRLDRIARPARRFRGFPITDKDLLSSNAQRLLNENVLTGDTIKDYDTLAHIITTATELSTRYEQLPPRLSDRTRNLLQRRRELRHGETGRNTAETIEYAEICKLARRSIQEDLRQRHIQIFSHAIHTGRLRFGRMQLLHSKWQLTILKEATTALSRNSFDSDHETLAHGNHRPISLLSTLYKVLTKILTRRLRNTIDKRSILPPEQVFAFLA
ncbi:hypothetical protein Y032_0611g635 [Ancylostoma ceylanicum]|uniref:Uncharacterized protein n=1 Tax=Ancylostoma ceylanicum TaxID=53326 RepID=A0A016WKX2_9BILA|nr:hypothetical protein Y032_0611g635 [Ancylostoma ceylanicum]